MAGSRRNWPGVERLIALLPFVLLENGCSPLANLRPASGVARGHSAELGAGAALLLPRPSVDESMKATGQVWAMTETGSVVTLSAIAAFDSDAFGLGAALRFDMLRQDRLAIGMEAELGYAWAAVSVPIAVRMWGQNWAYAGPRIGTWGTHPLFALPIGASFDAGEGVALRAEGQPHFESFAWDNRRFVLGAGAAYQPPDRDARKTATTGR